MSLEAGSSASTHGQRRRRLRTSATDSLRNLSPTNGSTSPSQDQCDRFTSKSISNKWFGYEKVDRILVSVESEQQFLLTNVIVLSRGISDYTPLLLNNGRTPSCGNQSLFKFEFGRFLRDGFVDMVKEI
jgi:hypothetical protein